MGLIKLRDKDIALARDDRHGDSMVKSLADAARLEKKLPISADGGNLIQRFQLQAEIMGLALEKKSGGSKLARMSTTYYGSIRLGSKYDSLSDEWKSVLLAHELVHARQWRHFGRRTFRTRYLFWTRWRWAIEVQAYRESVRMLIALGASKGLIESYIDARTKSLLSNYTLSSLNLKNVRTATVKLLREVI